MPPPIRDQIQSGTSSAGASSLSWSHTVGSGSRSALVVNTTESSGANISASGANWDDSGTPQPLERKGRVNDSIAGGWAEQWFVLAPVAGTKTIKVIYSGSCACTTGSASYLEVDPAAPFNAASPQTNIGSHPAQPSLNVTSSVDEIVIDCVNDNEQGLADTLVPTAPQTAIHSITVSNNTAGGSSEADGSSLVPMAWTGVSSSSPWAIIGVSLRGSDTPYVTRSRKLATQQRMVT